MERLIWVKCTLMEEGWKLNVERERSSSCCVQINTNIITHPWFESVILLSHHPSHTCELTW